jgi:peptide-methionine (R)-S-oxide reductase
MMPETKIDRQISESGYDITPLIDAERERLGQKLTREEADILLNHGTEPPFCGKFDRQ